jgi:hypothetical protein
MIILTKLKINRRWCMKYVVGRERKRIKIKKRKLENIMSLVLFFAFVRLILSLYINIYYMNFVRFILYT